MGIENIRLGKSAITDTVYAGYLSHNGKEWSKKTDVTNDFLGCVIERWNGYEETIKAGDRTFIISVKEVKS